MNSPEPEDDDCINSITCCGARKAASEDAVQTLHDMFHEDLEEDGEAELAMPLLGSSSARGTTPRGSRRCSATSWFGKPPSGRNVCADPDADGDAPTGRPPETAPEPPSASSSSRPLIEEAADGEAEDPRPQTPKHVPFQGSLCGAMDVIALHEEELERQRRAAERAPRPRHPAEAPPLPRFPRRGSASDSSRPAATFREASTQACEADLAPLELPEPPRTPPAKTSARRKHHEDALAREDSGKLLLTPISVQTVRSPGLLSERSTSAHDTTGDRTQSTTARGRKSIGFQQSAILTPMSIATESPGSVRAKKGSTSRFFRTEDLPDFLLRTPDSMVTDCHTAARAATPSPRRSRSCSSIGSLGSQDFGDDCGEGVDGGIEKRMPRPGLVARLFGEEAGFGGPHARSEIAGPLWWPASSNDFV